MPAGADILPASNFVNFVASFSEKELKRLMKINVYNIEFYQILNTYYKQLFLNHNKYNCSLFYCQLHKDVVPIAFQTIKN